MSMKSKTKRFLIVLILTLSGLIIFNWQAKQNSHDDQLKSNQNLQSHAERLEQIYDEYNQKLNGQRSTS